MCDKYGDKVFCRLRSTPVIEQFATIFATIGYEQFKQQLKKFLLGDWEHGALWLFDMKLLEDFYVHTYLYYWLSDLYKLFNSIKAIEYLRQAGQLYGTNVHFQKLTSE